MTARATVLQRIASNHSPVAGRVARPRRAIPLGLALAAYLLALLQRPGQLAADTKIDLHTDPVGFLADAAAAWAPSGGLGQVQAGQYAGYLWPMAPFHALGDVVGLAPWVVQRLWLGTLLALAAWGTVRLLDALLERPRGVAHLVAGALMVANPYVVVFANRTSVTLLAYALLPWLLLAVHRGLRDPRGWWWPAATALLVTSLGGGVNAAVASWVLLGPALLIVHDATFAEVAWRDARRFLVRALPLTALASAWWIAPVLVQIGYGVDFLPFTEPAGAIWTSTSMSESLRLMGFWVAYLGVGYGPELTPAFDTGPTLLYAPLVLFAGFAIPALAIAGFAWTRRLRYGPFFVALALIALLAMFTGFPDGAPLRRALHNAYDEVELVRFLRTAYKAGPLLALALACLAGMAAGVLWPRLRGRVLATGLALVVAGALTVAWAWPLFERRAIDGQISFDDVPADWERAAVDVERELPRGTRAIVLPGQIFPFYRWGGTQDAILPALTDRPVSVRGVVPYADLRAVELLWATDSLVQQRRTFPGQLAPLLDLMGAGTVIVGSDDDRFRSGAVAPAAAAGELARGAALGVPDRRHGAVRSYALPAPSGLVRVRPLAGARVVDGSAGALTALAALGGLSRADATLYAADLTPAELRGAARDGAEIVVSDSNRRRVVLPSQPRQAEGATLAASAIPADGPVLDPFPDRGSEAQTVAVYDGARSLTAPFSPSFVQFPEHRPYAALDGDPRTWWNADRHLDEEDRWIEIDFGRRIDVGTLSLLPQRETATELREVEIAGERYPLRRGWNRLAVGLEDIDRLRVTVTGIAGPRPGRTRGAGAIAELRVPGVRVRERLRPPVLASRALAGTDVRAASLTYLFERTTGTDPFDRDPRPDPDATSVPERDNQSGALVAAAGDGELSIARRFELPAPRRWRADGWVTAAPGRAATALGRWGDPGGGRIDAPCGAVSARVTVGGSAATLRMRPEGSMADLARGLPVRARPCGPAVALSAGEATLVSGRGPLRADILRLRSPGARPPADPGRPVGEVVDPGDDGRGSRTGVRVSLREPVWLILAESFNRGWRAECDGRDLGEPRPIDGFANGWRAPADCREVSFDFRPQRAMTAGFAISGLTAVVLLALLAVAARRRRPPARGERRLARTDARPVGLPLRRALAAGLAVGVAGALLFALRAGLVIGPAVALILWRGVGAAPLALAAGALAGVAIPAIYLLFPPADDGGFNSDYANDVLGAHWVAVAVWVLLALALSRAIPRRRAAARGDAGEASAGP